MIRRINLRGLSSPQLFSTLPDFTIPAAFELNLANNQKMTARWLSDSVAAHLGRWFVSPRRAWKIRRIVIKRPDLSEAIYYYASREQWITAALSSGDSYTADFTVTDLPELEDHAYVECNFSQYQPVDSGGGVYVGVRLFLGDDTPRTFTDCNLSNCEAPPGSTVIGGNTAIVQRDLLSRTETVTIDGVGVSIDHHKNVVYGRWTPGGYDYKTTPEEFEVD